MSAQKKQDEITIINETLEDMKAEDIVIIDLKGKTSIASWMNFKKAMF